MRTHHIPTPYIQLFNCMLSRRQTCLHFDDFISDPIQVLNGTTQGCPLSMLLYTFYNVELIEIAHGKNELAAGFVDDCTFVPVADTLDETHRILKDMMECPNGGLDWSIRHNSKFEISKLAVMDLPRPHKEVPTTPLIIKQQHPDSSTTLNTTANVKCYKYLGTTFDPKLLWRAHITKVIASATCWTQQLWWISKTTGRLSPGKPNNFTIQPQSQPSLTPPTSGTYLHSKERTCRNPEAQLQTQSLSNQYKVLLLGTALEAYMVQPMM